jgi:stearoyl-CoA desaturase (Delta-9 desaturase)
MAPNKEDSSSILTEEWEPEMPQVEDTKTKAPTEIVWRNVYIMLYLHICAFYGLYLALTSAMYATLVFAYILHVLAGLGITAGAHRLWSHKSYKAKTPLRIFLMICNCMAVQNDIIEWSRDHRVHHKFSETNADPHNATRGFFFAHVGWLLCRKHPDVRNKGKTVDVADLERDPVLRFQRRYYLPLIFFYIVVLPVSIPIFMWGESFFTALFVCFFMRYCWTLNATWLVNSAAHLWGNDPYDKGINPKENVLVAIAAIGEGWHNYHHTFPMDYKTAEVPYLFNMTTAFIDMCAKLGLAYDLKSVPTDIINKRRMRTGDKFES